MAALAGVREMLNECDGLRDRRDALKKEAEGEAAPCDSSIARPAMAWFSHFAFQPETRLPRSKTSAQATNAGAVTSNQRGAVGDPGSLFMPRCRPFRPLFCSHPTSYLTEAE